MRVALVHDWLVGMRGGERCLEIFCAMFPEADIYTAFYNPQSLTDTITSHRVFASPFNRLPGVKKYYRHLLPAYPQVARSLSSLIAEESKKRKYDLVISVSHCLAKNVVLPEATHHLCYCLTPMRYIWDQYEAYFADNKLEPLIRHFARGLRKWDVAQSQGVDDYVCISEFVRERIAALYGRDADVVYPPVRTDWIKPREESEKGEGFLCVSALVPYKNVDLIVRTFNSLPYKLTIVGTGPEERKLRRIAKENVHFAGKITDQKLAELYRASKALVFAAEEDFGMVPVEMLAAGRPVICYAKGGALETVSTVSEKPTGIYFSELNTQSLATAIEEFTNRQQEFTVNNCVEQAQKFSLERFQNSFSRLLEPFELQDRNNFVFRNAVGA